MNTVDNKRRQSAACKTYLETEMNTLLHKMKKKETMKNGNLPAATTQTETEVKLDFRLFPFASSFYLFVLYFLCINFLVVVFSSLEGEILVKRPINLPVTYIALPARSSSD